MARTSRGRQRVEMVKMQNESNLQVTFSKRRTGLFKKANELNTLCGADIGIVVFSPPEVKKPKVFTFGHPSVEAVVERFLSDNNNPSANEAGGTALATEQLIEAHRNARIQELSMELMRLEASLEAEKKRVAAIDEIVAVNREAQGWMRASPDELSFHQLVTQKTGLENLMREIQQRANHFMDVHRNGTPFNPFAGDVFPSVNMAAGGSTSAFNFGTGGAALGAGALSFTSGASAASAFLSSVSMTSG